MADDQGKGAGERALAPDVLAARAAEQREREAAAFAEREYDLARQAAAARANRFVWGPAMWYVSYKFHVQTYTNPGRIIELQWFLYAPAHSAGYTY